MRILLTLVAAPALVAGCGAQDGPEATPAEYVAAADAACADSRGAIAALEEPGSSAAAIAYRRAVLEIGRNQLMVLRDLDVPGALRDRHERVLDALDEQHGILGEALRRIDAGADAGVVAEEISGPLTDLEIEMRAIARAMNLEVCGSDRRPIVWAGGPEHRGWREDYLTTVDGGLFFAENLDPPPTLTDLADRDLGLIAEADSLLAAFDRLATREPPPAAIATHEFMVKEIRPVAVIWKDLAVAVEARDTAAYAAALARMDVRQADITRLEDALPQ